MEGRGSIPHVSESRCRRGQTTAHLTLRRPRSAGRGRARGERLGRLRGHLTGALPRALLHFGPGPLGHPRSRSPRTCRGPTSPSIGGPPALRRGALGSVLGQPRWLNTKHVTCSVQKGDEATHPVSCGAVTSTSGPSLPSGEVMSCAGSETRPLALRPGSVAAGLVTLGGPDFHVPVQPAPEDLTG